MNFNKSTFFDHFRQFYKQKTGKRSLSEQTVGAVDFLLDQFASNPLWKDINQVAYAFATIAHETAWTFMPIKEYRAKAGTKGRANQDRYWLTGFFGRGYVQLTWLKNYQKATDKLGVNFVANPALALRQDLAFKILTYGMLEGWFTTKKLSKYINSSLKDYKGARYVINGQDKAALIAGYAAEFEKMLKDSLSSSSNLIDKTGDSQPIEEGTAVENPQEFDDEGNPIETSDPNEPIDSYPEDPKPGEPTPETAAEPGAPIVGGRPTDPPVDVKPETPAPTSGLGAWATYVRTQWATLGLGGMSLGSLTFFSNPLYVYIALGLAAVAILVGVTVLITTMVIKHREKMKREEWAAQQTLKKMEIASMPDRYNVNVLSAGAAISTDTGLKK